MTLMLMLMTTLMLLAVGVLWLTRRESTGSMWNHLTNNGTETSRGMVPALGLVMSPTLAPVPLGSRRGLATHAKLGRDHRFTT